MYTVIKANGEKEPFSEEKLRRSIERAGIPSEMQNEVIQHITSKLYDNMPTLEIYRHIIEFLAHSKHPYTKGAYSLKRAIMSLGPTGYPFEDFLSDILTANGYKTKTRSIIAGQCIAHEIDIVAEMDGKKIMVECKFHNMPGIKTNIHVALYTKARFDDIRVNNHFDQAWLITNTKITTDVITYGECVGLKIISWSYPEKEALRDLIESTGLIPITALTTLTNTQKQQLILNHAVLVRDIFSQPDNLTQLNISDSNKNKILAEASFLLKRA